MKHEISASDELKKVQNILRKSEEKYRGIFENAVEGMFQTTPDGRFITVNPALAHIMGFETPEEAISKIADIAQEIYVNPEDRIAYRSLLEKDGAVSGYETQIYGKNREILWVSISARAVSRKGKVRYYEGSIEDITKRKETEIAINALEDLESSILSAIPHAVVGLEGRRIIFANNAVKDVFGWEPDEIVGESTRILYRNDEEYERIGRHFYPILESKEVHIEEFYCRRKDGSDILCLVSASRIGSTLDKKRVVAVYQDVTEKKQIELALKESEEKYRNIVENSTEGIFQSAPGGGYIMVNTTMAKIHGYDSAEEFLKSVKNIGTQIYVEAHRWEELRRLLESDGFVTGFESLRYRRDGSQIWAATNARAVKDRNGTTLYYEGTVIDITERKKYEKVLAESEERYRTAIEHSNDGVTLIKNDTHIYVNQRFVEMFGYTNTAEVVGKAQFNIVHPDDREKVRSFREKRLRGEEVPQRYEFLGVKKDGTVIDIEVSATRTTYMGEPVLLAYLQDITGRKASERALNETMKRLSKSANAIVDVIVLAVESRDPYTAGHQRRVAALAAAIARKMGLSDMEIEGLKMAGMIHDLGKISIPAEILTTPRKLTELEYELMKVHSQIGFNILRNVDFPWPIADIVHQHHERIDGSGYPLGLKGDEIRLEAKILAVADSFEAMVSHRPYRPSQGVDAAVSETRKGRGVIFDPTVADICICLFTEEGFQF